MGVKVDQEKYDFVKTLIDAGLRTTQIREIAGISDCTVTNIRQSENLEDYRDIVSQQFAKKRAYDLAKAGLKETPVKAEDPIKVQEGTSQSYTVTMVIGTDEEHQKYVAPLTALINALFESDNVAVECKRADA